MSILQDILTTSAGFIIGFIVLDGVRAFVKYLRRLIAEKRRVRIAAANRGRIFPDELAAANFQPRSARL